MAKHIFFFLVASLLLTSSFSKPALLRAEEGVDEDEVKSTISSDPDHRAPRKKAAAPATPAPPVKKSPAAALSRESVSKGIAIDEKEKKIVTKKISFAPDSDILTPASETILKDLAVFLKGKSDLSIRIETHTDSLGSDQKNRTLSQQRSDRIRRFLVTGGVPEQRLESIGMGDEYPVASDATPEGQEKNRRVNFVVLSSSSPNPESLPMLPISQIPSQNPPAIAAQAPSPETSSGAESRAVTSPSVASEPALPPGLVPQAAISAPISTPPETAPAAPLSAVSAPIVPPATQPSVVPMSPETAPIRFP